MYQQFTVRGFLDSKILENLGFVDVTSEASNTLCVSSEDSGFVRESCDLHPIFRGSWLALEITIKDARYLFERTETSEGVSYRLEFDDEASLSVMRDDSNWKVTLWNIFESEISEIDDCRNWGREEEDAAFPRFIRCNTTPFNEVTRLIAALARGRAILLETLFYVDSEWSPPQVLSEKFTLFSVFVGRINNVDLLKKFSSEDRGVDVTIVQREGEARCVFWGERFDTSELGF